jgi:Phage integrase family
VKMLVASWSHPRPNPAWERLCPSVSQAEGRGFETRRPLQRKPRKREASRRIEAAQALQHAVTNVQLRAVNFHSLRSQLRDRDDRAGHPLRTLQEWMGHADARTTQIYADYLPNAIEARALTERAFGGRSHALPRRELERIGDDEHQEDHSEEHCDHEDDLKDPPTRRVHAA